MQFSCTGIGAPLHLFNCGVEIGGRFLAARSEADFCYILTLFAEHDSLVWSQPRPSLPRWWIVRRMHEARSIKPEGQVVTTGFHNDMHND